MADLLPCPFCGGTNLSVVGAWVECECCAFGPGHDDADGRAAWNSRADDRWKREATAVLADIADAIGPAALLGESHGATIRRLIVERNDFALLARSGHAGATWLTQEKGKAEDRLDLAREILEEAIKALPPHDPNADHVRAMARAWLEAKP